MDYRTELRVRLRGKNLILGDHLKSELSDLEDVTTIQVNGHELSLINAHRNIVRELEELGDERDDE